MARNQPLTGEGIVEYSPYGQEYDWGTFAANEGQLTVTVIKHWFREKLLYVVVDEGHRTRIITLYGDVIDVDYPVDDDEIIYLIRQYEQQERNHESE